MLTVEKAALGYGRRAVLRHVNLEIARGSFAGVLGPNGSGKTTLLKTLAGIIPPLEGRVVLQGTPVLGYVPQREALDPLGLLAAMEVALMGVCGRIGPGRRLGRAGRDLTRQCLRDCGAEDLAQQRFGQLSGGQKQRVLIARALAAQPDFLVLDEPTAGIDAAAAQAIAQLLVKLHRERGLTILLVTHDLALARQHLQEVVWVRDGRVEHGPVSQFLTRDKIEEMLELQLS